jgi:chromosome segregation ATPase
MKTVTAVVSVFLATASVGAPPATAQAPVVSRPQQAPTSTSALPSDADRARLERSRKTIKDELEQLAQELNTGNAALASFDAFTRALSSGLAAEEQARRSCQDLREIVDRGGPFRDRNERRYLQCLESVGASSSIIAKANRLLDGIQRDIDIIREQLDAAKKQVGSLSSQNTVAEVAVDLDSKLARSIGDKQRALGLGM